MCLQNSLARSTGVTGSRSLGGQCWYHLKVLNTRRYKFLTQIKSHRQGWSLQTDRQTNWPKTICPWLIDGRWRWSIKIKDHNSCVQSDQRKLHLIYVLFLYTNCYNRTSPKALKMWHMVKLFQQVQLSLVLLV